MIHDKGYVPINEEEEKQYVIEDCIGCEFYPCECTKEFYQCAKLHSKDFDREDFGTDYATEIVPIKKKNIVLNVIASVSVTSVGEFERDEKEIVVEPISITPVEENIPSVREKYDSDTDFLSYDREELKNGCTMGIRHVTQVECGRKTVTDGIGDHFKIETTWDYKIEKDSDNRWEPLQPVVISAQTGQGKNYFIENSLIPYVVEMNYKNNTDMKVLIFSNRLALKCQIDNHLRRNDDFCENDEDRIYSYKEVADVMTYQSVLHKKDWLERIQKNKRSQYIFVICDEAHFITSDAMFNPYTQKILTAIVSLFQKSIRIYMSATPYECLEYIEKYEKGQILLYHFKRDYSYLNVNTYSDITELYCEIIKSVAKKEKWLIFIDDKEKCKKVKDELEIKGKEMNVIMNSTDSEFGKIYAVDADSKKDEVYNLILQKEKLVKGVSVLITTSVLDNGVNLSDIDNIIVSDMSKVKCLQMVGRARTNGSNDHKNLYIKRFDKEYVGRRIYELRKQKEAYHEFELAYGDSDGICHSHPNDEYRFLNKYYDGSEKDWKNAKRWFGRSPKDPYQIYPNVIAKSLLERYLSKYETIYQEMKQEQAEIEASDQEVERHPGQKYLEYQLSWFGKKYCMENDLTFCKQGKATKLFLDFLKSYADENRKIDKEEQESFRKKFTELYDAAFSREDPNKNRNYGITNMKKLLKKRGIGYEVVSRSSYWEIIESEKDSEEMDSE